jgi:ribosomal protein S18 acetylase RimI-like enzyme
MEAVETYVRKHGGNSVGLNVFGFNTVARSLYESLGYITQNIGMKKNLVGKS